MDKGFCWITILLIFLNFNCPVIDTLGECSQFCYGEWIDIGLLSGFFYTLLSMFFICPVDVRGDVVFDKKTVVWLRREGCLLVLSGRDYRMETRAINNRANCVGGGIGFGRIGMCCQCAQ